MTRRRAFTGPMLARIVALATALAFSLGAAGLAQTSPPPAPSAAPGAASACVQKQALLGGIGRASVVAFTGPVLGAPVCATVANLAFDAFSARIAAAPSSDALVVAALTGGGGVTLPLEGATLTSAGPYVIAPGGTLPDFGGDVSEAPRVVIAYAGQRVLVIGTTPVALVDLARALRDHPGSFDADAIERAVVIASGPSAALSLSTADGTFGTVDITAPRLLLLVKR
jgi:hypothetical protein